MKVQFINITSTRRVYLTNNRAEAMSFQIMTDGEIVRTEHGNFLIYV